MVSRPPTTDGTEPQVFLPEADVTSDEEFLRPITFTNNYVSDRLHSETLQAVENMPAQTAGCDTNQAGMRAELQVYLHLCVEGHPQEQQFKSLMAAALAAMTSAEISTLIGMKTGDGGWKLEKEKLSVLMLVAIPQVLAIPFMHLLVPLARLIAGRCFSPWFHRSLKCCRKNVLALPAMTCRTPCSKTPPSD